jgi:xanthine/uracil permease
MPLAAQDRSLGDLLRELSTETGDLLRKEVELAKAEMSEKASKAGSDLGAAAVGGGMAFAGSLVLLYALITGFTALLDTFLPLGVAVWLAPLIIGAVLVFIGYGRITKALAELKGTSLAPRQTTQSLQENKQWLKAKIQ